jgi:hypothetical protein
VVAATGSRKSNRGRGRGGGERQQRNGGLGGRRERQGGGETNSAGESSCNQPNATTRGYRGRGRFPPGSWTNQQGDMTTDVAARTKAMWYTYHRPKERLRQQGITRIQMVSIRHTSAVSWAVRLCYLERQPSRHRKPAVNLKILRRIVPGAYAATPLEELITLAANHGCLILKCRIYQICLRYIGHVERMENDARRNTCSTAPWPSQT